MFGQLAVGPCLTPPLISPIFVPFSVYYLKTVVGMLTGHSFLAPPFLWPSKPRCWPHAFSFGNRARVVGLARSPTMRTPSPTTKLLAGMLASEAGGRRVIYQKYTLNKINTYGGALRPRGQRFRAKVRPGGREIAEKGRLAGHIGLVFHIGGSP